MELEDIPLGQRQSLQADGTVARPRSNKDSKGAGPQKRANKNRPQEISSRKPVPRLREVIQVPKKEFLDPRFESLSGKLDEGRFRKSYSFLYDEELPAEAQRLRALLKKAKDPDRHGELQKHVSRIDNMLSEEQQRRKQEARDKAWKAAQSSAVKDGKQPFYLKKSEKKKMELIEKYQELKASGKLEAYLAKKRKKKASKDRRLMPDAREDKPRTHYRARDDEVN